MYQDPSGQRDAITAALMNIANPPPQNQLPQMPQMPQQQPPMMGGSQAPPSMPPPGTPPQQPLPGAAPPQRLPQGMPPIPNGIAAPGTPIQKAY